MIIIFSSCSDSNFYKYDEGRRENNAISGIRYVENSNNFISTHVYPWISIK